MRTKVYKRILFLVDIVMNAVMNKCLALLLFVLSSFVGFSGEHPLHICVTQLDYRPEQKSIQITIKVFADDFEDVLKQEYSLSKLPAGQSFNELIFSYATSNFKIKANEKDQSYNWVGYEEEADAIFIYLEITNLNKLRSLEVNNTLLFQLYDDQSNIVHFSWNEIRKSEMFEVGDSWKSIELVD